MITSAKIVADSFNLKTGRRITTFAATYHRFILAEVNTHRALARNTSSSRAIPVAKIIAQVRDNPALPVSWGKNQKGMQADAELSPEQQAEARRLWLLAAANAIEVAESMNALGLHKQVANRILEPFQYVTTLLTGTEWGNFFNLRLHKDAQPEFRCLAKHMALALKASTPVVMVPGDWHLPFADRDLQAGLPLSDKLKIVTARAARVSYLNFEGAIDPQKDFDLHDSLQSSGHMSPFEHAAQALGTDTFSGNFRGWSQYRKTIPRENQEAVDLDELLAAFPDAIV